MTKSPRAVAQEALRLAQESLPAYSAVRSRKDFTQHQLFAILALKTFFKTDYRGAVQLLADFAELRDDLGLTKVPHYSTLCYAAKRLLKKADGQGRPVAASLLAQIVAAKAQLEIQPEVGGIVHQRRPQKSRHFLPGALET
jgi:hypothetical protein